MALLPPPDLEFGLYPSNGYLFSSLSSLSASAATSNSSSSSATFSPGPCLPQWSLLAKVFTIQILLSDVPLIALGMLGFGIALVWGVLGGWGAAEGVVVGSAVAGFLAGVADLSQVLVVKASNRQPTTLPIIQQLLLALSLLLVNTYTFLLASSPPTHELLSPLMPSLRRSSGGGEEEGKSGFYEDEEEEDRRRQGWSSASWGVFFGVRGSRWKQRSGQAVEGVAIGLIVVVFALTAFWRVASLFAVLRPFQPFYFASLVSQLVLSLVLAAKIVRTCVVASASESNAGEGKERTLGTSLREFAGALIGIGVQVGLTGTGLGIVMFSETPVGRFLQTLSIYILSLSQLVRFFHLRDVRHQRRSPPPSLGSSYSPSAGGPSPRARAERGRKSRIASWFDNVPHLLSLSSTSRSDPADVEIQVGSAADFRTPRSALARDLGMPLTGGTFEVRRDASGRGIDKGSRMEGARDERLTRPEMKQLASNGTFLPLDNAVKIHVVNGSSTNAPSSRASSLSTSSSASNLNGPVLSDIGHLLLSRSAVSDESEGAGMPSPDRLNLPKLPSVHAYSPGGRRTSEEEGERLIRSMTTRGSGLSLPPLRTLVNPPPRANVTFDVQRSVTQTTRSTYSQDSNRPSSTESTVVLPPPLPPALLSLSNGASTSEGAAVNRTSTRASATSVNSWTTSQGIASMYLDFPPPPPAEASTSNAPSTLAHPSPSKIGLALGGDETDSTRASFTNYVVGTSTDWREVVRLQPSRFAGGGRGRRFGGGKEEREQEENLVVGGRVDLGTGADVDVTSFIAGSRDTLRDSDELTLTPRRFQLSSRQSAASPLPPHSPATIHQAQLLVRQPSLKVTPKSSPSSTSLGTPESRTPTKATINAAFNGPSPTTTKGVSAEVCLKRMENASRAEGISDVVFHERLLGQGGGVFATPPLTDPSLSRPNSTVDLATPSTSSHLPRLAPSANLSSLGRSGSFRDRLSTRSNAKEGPAPLSLIPTKKTKMKTLNPSWIGI